MEKIKMSQYAFGVDIGGTTIKLGFFRTDGALLHKWEIPTRKENNGEQILPDVARAIKGEMKKSHLRTEDILGLGIDVPGPVIKGGVVNRCVNLGWGVVELEKDASALTGFDIVKAEHDANAAALGEMWKGGGRGCRNMVLITLGTGVGGGMIYDGTIIGGVNGAAGEPGHITVREEETQRCGCGKRGCLEQYVSARGIVKLAREYFCANPDVASVIDRKTPDAKAVFDAAKQGDRAGIAIAQEMTRMLGKACAAIACVIDPEVFVIGGGVSKAGSYLTELIEKYYRQYAFHASRNTPFHLAELGNDAGIYGAVKPVIAPVKS